MYILQPNTTSNYQNTPQAPTMHRMAGLIFARPLLDIDTNLSRFTLGSGHSLSLSPTLPAPLFRPNHTSCASASDRELPVNTNPATHALWLTHRACACSVIVTAIGINTMLILTTGAVILSDLSCQWKSQNKICFLIIYNKCTNQ